MYHRGTQHIRNTFIINSGEKQLLFFRQQACQILFTDKELLNTKVKSRSNLRKKVLLFSLIIVVAIHNQSHMNIFQFTQMAG